MPTYMLGGLGKWTEKGLRSDRYGILMISTGHPSRLCHILWVYVGALGGMASMHVGGCQNHGPLLGPLNTRCRLRLRN